LIPLTTKQINYVWDDFSIGYLLSASTQCGFLDIDYLLSYLKKKLFVGNLVSFRLRKTEGVQ